MTPPSEAWEPWVYRGAMMLIGGVNLAAIITFDLIMAFGNFPPGTEQLRLQYMFYGHLCHFGLTGLQLYGLVSRNLVRAKIRAKILGAELDVE